MNDLAADLKRIRQTTIAIRVVPVPAPSPRRTRALLAGSSPASSSVAAVVAWRLWQLDYFWTNPLDGVVVQRLTDFSGDEIDAAISPDGNFTAFLSDRDGRSMPGSPQRAAADSSTSPRGAFPFWYPGPIRYVGFSDDNSQLWFIEQVSVRPNRLRAWLTPVVPGNIVGSWRAGESCLVARSNATGYHTPDEGDPIFIADRNGNNRRQIYVDRPGIHNHFLTWSPDGRYIYFVRGGHDGRNGSLALRRARGRCDGRARTDHSPQFACRLPGLARSAHAHLLGHR